MGLGSARPSFNEELHTSLSDAEVDDSFSRNPDESLLAFVKEEEGEHHTRKVEEEVKKEECYGEVDETPYFDGSG